MKKYASSTLSLSIGLVLGWLIWGGQLPQVISRIVNKSTQQQKVRNGELLADSPSQTNTLWKSSNDTLGKLNSENASIHIAAEDVGMLLSCNISTLEERINLIGPADPLARFLAISPQEIASLNTTWHDISGQINSTRSTNTDISDSDDGSVLLKVGPFSEKGKSLQEAFYKQVVQTLGPARARALLDSIKTPTAFSQWGKKPSSYRIAVLRQADESLLYEIQELQPKTQHQIRKWRASRIPAHLKALTDSQGISPTP